jgi:aldehyde dehydrogenase (NAD+)
MNDYGKFYIDGQWVESDAPRRELIDPASGQPYATIAMGTPDDVDQAVRAARRAFIGWSETPPAARAAMLDRVIAGYQARSADLAAAITQEIGAPGWLSATAHVPSGLAHLLEARRLLDSFEFEHTLPSGARVLREAAGVCALITPWNWPANQVLCKVAPALAAGCTVVLKPSQHSPLDALILAEIIHEAGLPAGVFNLVNGSGAQLGDALASHPEVDLVSLTGSNQAGVSVMQAAAPTIKRVSLELGGKSANIILDDANLEKAVASGIIQLMSNCGQTCTAPSRMLVPADRQDEAKAIAAGVIASLKVQQPASAEKGALGPLANEAQFRTVSRYIDKGIEEGATLVAGGPGRPEGLDAGFFVRPTVFADVQADMVIAQEEIFGPVLVIIPYQDEDDAFEIDNNSIYGLAGYVQSGDVQRARRVARRLRAGTIQLNGARPDFGAPFGGYKQSGIGREWGIYGLEEFTEVKSVLGWGED